MGKRTVTERGLRAPCNLHGRGRGIRTLKFGGRGELGESSGESSKRQRERERERERERASKMK